MSRAATLASLLQHAVSYPGSRPDGATMAAVLDEAERFADGMLAPRAAAADRAGCRMERGRVRTAPGHVEAWAAFARAGWVGLTTPEEMGGQGLPLALATAVQALADAADPAFGMLAINARCATRLLLRHGSPGLRSAWLPRLASGEWAATIAISEPQAGSDVGRIATRADRSADGSWSVTGTKCWISYGDHDLAARIGHFVLARPRGAPAGSRGLSLFLVPNLDESGRPNGVVATGLEEKLGLHASPTSTLAFEGAQAVLLGDEGRGLPTLFAMIVSMRLAVATQGAALAQASLELARGYAAQRRQGGDASAPPVAIQHHAEVQRLLLASMVRTEIATLLALESASMLDAAEQGDASAGAIASILLPVAKTLGAEAAFANADAAIQVLGGAGYVRDWAAERHLRDSRIFSIYEGTTAMQGIDLLERRVIADGTKNLSALFANLPCAESERVVAVAQRLSGLPPRSREAASVPFLHLLGTCLGQGLLARAGQGTGAVAGVFAALASQDARTLKARCDLLGAECLAPPPDRLFSAAFHVRSETAAA